MLRLTCGAVRDSKHIQSFVKFQLKICIQIYIEVFLKKNPSYVIIARDSAVWQRVTWLLRATCRLEMSSPKKIKRTSQRTLRIFFPTLKVGSTDDQDSQLLTGKCENDTAASPENPRDEILKRGPRLQQRASNVTQNSKIFRGRPPVLPSKGL